MSGNLKLNTSSGGSIALTPADTVSNITVTVPAATGTLATSESTLAQFNASGSAPVYACRAWVNFNGTGTVAIRASGNVSSITDNGTGNYTVNFTTAMPDTNYSCNVTGNYNRIGHTNDQADNLTTSVIVATNTASNTVSDAAQVSVVVFR